MYSTLLKKHFQKITHRRAGKKKEISTGETGWIHSTATPRPAAAGGRRTRTHDQHAGPDCRYELVNGRTNTTTRRKAPGHVVPAAAAVGAGLLPAAAAAAVSHASRSQEEKTRERGKRQEGRKRREATKEGKERRKEKEKER